MAAGRAGRRAAVATLWHRSLVTTVVAGVLVVLVAALPASTASAAPSTRPDGTPIGTLLATLAHPTATSADNFGYSVAVSGTTAVVGAAAYSNSGAGAAYIYVKGASGWPTTPTATLNDPAATSDDHFGYSVAVSGKTAVVGAPGTNSFAGTAYISQA